MCWRPRVTPVWRWRGVVTQASLVQFLKQTAIMDRVVPSFRASERLGDDALCGGRRNAHFMCVLFCELNAVVVLCVASDRDRVRVVELHWSECTAAVTVLFDVAFCPALAPGVLVWMFACCVTVRWRTTLRWRTSTGCKPALASPISLSSTAKASLSQLVATLLLRPLRMSPRSSLLVRDVAPSMLCASGVDSDFAWWVAL